MAEVGTGVGQQKENMFSRKLRAGNRNYYLDVRENNRGTFLKLTESSGRRRSTILVSKGIMDDLLSALSIAVSGSYEDPPQEAGKWTTLYSKRVTGLPSSKRIYVDVKENDKGKVFSVAEISDSHGKTAVMVPEEAWKEFKDALQEVNSHFPEGAVVHEEKENSRNTNRSSGSPRKDGKVKGNSKEVAFKKFSFRGKRFFFDYLENEQGRYLRLSEARNRRKDTVNIPSDCLEVVIALLRNTVKEDYTSPIPGLNDQEQAQEEDDERKPNFTMLYDKVMQIEKVDAEEGDEESDTRTYVFQLRENDNGKYLRVAETRQQTNRTTAVFLPEEKFEESADILQEFLQVE